MTQFKQEIEQLREIRRKIVSVISSDTSMDYKAKNKVLSGSYFALKTLEKILEDLGKRDENQDH
ncbi:MAG: hypothetical protein V7K67_07560 [Nostoc sp.]